MEEIVQIEPRSDLTINVIWSDGRNTCIDFTPIIERSPVFNVMRDPDFFVSEAKIAHTGSAIAWSDILEFSPDGLRYDASLRHTAAISATQQQNSPTADC